MVPSSDAPIGAQSAASRLRILFVEDELLIRLVVSDELREVGYEVVECFNADEAIILLQAGVRFDLIVSDVRMPGGVDGMGLLAFTKELYPDVPVILASGHLEPTLALRHGATRFLSKPYGIDVVVDAVRAELATAQ